MNDNPFAPPTAAVADAPAVPLGGAEPVWFAVTPLKLLLMNFGTLGIYPYYWVYKNWVLHKQRTGADITPFARAFFAIIFIFPLFKAIDAEAERLGTRRFAAGPLALAWIVSSVLWKLPDPYWLVIYLSVLAMLPVQRAVDAMNRAVAPEHDRNGRIRGWNWLAMLVGLPFFGLAVLSAFLPDA